MRRLSLAILSIVGLTVAAPLVCVADSGRQGLLSTTTDPSLVPDEDMLEAGVNPSPWSERHRVLVDLNGDGEDDLILSAVCGLFGNGGGPWVAYVHTNGVWTALGEVDFHPGSFTFERTMFGDVRLWHYSHLSGHDGYLGYYTFCGGRLREERPVRFLIDTGDAGTSLGNAIYKAVFETKHDYPFRHEYSVSTNGVISWHPIVHSRGIVLNDSRENVALPDPNCIRTAKEEECSDSDKPVKKIIRHKVRDDEDVTGLSILYDMPTDEIRRRNKLKRDEDVRPSQMVELEVDYDFVDSR